MRAKVSLIPNGIFLEGVLVHILKVEEVKTSEGTIYRLKLRSEGVDRDGDPTLLYRDAWSADLFSVGEHAVCLRVKGHPSKEDLKLWITKLDLKAPGGEKAKASDRVEAK